MEEFSKTTNQCKQSPQLRVFNVGYFLFIHKTKPLMCTQLDVTIKCTFSWFTCQLMNLYLFKNSLLMNCNSSCSNSSDNCFINSVINQITGIYYFANEGLHGIEAF